MERGFVSISVQRAVLILMEGWEVLVVYSHMVLYRCIGLFIYLFIFGEGLIFHFFY